MVLKNLVISGGGINGIGFIGILKYLSENNLLKNVNHYFATIFSLIQHRDRKFRPRSRKSKS